MAMANMAYAADAKVWIQPVGGGNHIVLAASETAVVQVWMEVFAIPYGGRMENIQMVLNANDQAGALTVGTIGANGAHIDVAGFIDHGPWGNFTRSGSAEPGRGFVANPPGVNEALEGYQIIFADVVTPWTGASGVGPGTYLLDEIIIHGVSNTTANPLGDTATADTILNPGGVQAPGGFKIYPSFSTYAYYGASVTVGTGYTPAKGAALPLYVSVVPEPASLSLLVLGGLAAIRRRR